ncbi:MAG: DUF3999 family protein [Exilibacterium sp.]
MFRLMTLLFSLGFSITASAQPPFKLNDYAWQAPIGESAATLQRLDLNLEILRGMSHRHAADIAVFDANGQPLPTLLRRKPPIINEKWDNLSNQRFERSKAGHGAKVILDQQQYDESTGQVTRLGIHQQLRVQQQRPDYIIELSKRQLQLGIDAIELDWTHEPAGDFLKLDIQAANDIDHWKTIQHGKNLFKGQGRGGEWVTLGELPAGYRYFRLRPHASVTRFELKRARGRYQVEEAPADFALAGRALEEDAKHTGFFAFSPPLAVDARAMRFVLPNGYFLSGNLYASHGEFDQKQLLRRGIEQHNLEGMDEGGRVSLDFSAQRRYWFEPRHQSMQDVGLEFFYPPYEILFINNRQGPFTLAWGNYEVERHPDDLSRLVAQQSALELSQAVTIPIGRIDEAGGLRRQFPVAVKPWLTWMLWALLALAVLVTARMAWTLYRDMNH